MANGSYYGANTVFSLADFDWFGVGDLEVPREERKQRIQAELRRWRDMGLSQRPTRLQRKLYRAIQTDKVLDMIAESLADQPSIAPDRPSLDRAAETKIAELKRDIAVYATQARSAAARHESSRQELLTLLAKHHISPHTYPETLALSLDS